MFAVGVALLVGSGGAAAHLLSDLDNGCTQHSAGFDWRGLTVAALAFVVGICLSW